MHFEWTLFHIEHSVTLRLLRDRHAPLILSFFFFAFKSRNRLQIPYVELHSLLTQFLDSLDEEAKQSVSLSPQKLLDVWSDDQHAFIRKYFELNQDEPMTELTADTERAIEWMQSLEKKEFVGTQSRFLSIYDNMRKIADQTEHNPASRLNFLKEQKKEIEEEMKQIQATGIVNRMDPTQIRERFLHLIEDSRRLISEFRLIEEIFKDITRKIKEKKLKEAVTKGEILREVLDAHDALEESDQGRSFAAFWHFLISGDQENQLRTYSEKILNTPEIQAFVNKNPDRQLDTHLLKLKSQLLQVGQKVLKSKVRLSEELRKLLHQKALMENKRVLSLSASIKKMALEHREVFLSNEMKEFINLANGFTVQLPLSRPLWKPNTEARFTSKALVPETELDNHQAVEALTAMVKNQPISTAELESRIRKTLNNASQISLREVVKQFPIQFGLIEIFSYIDIASKNSGHMIHAEETEHIPCDAQGFVLTIPKIIFTQAGNAL